MKKLFSKKTILVYILISFFFSLLLPYSLSIKGGTYKNVAQAGVPVSVLTNPFQLTWDVVWEKMKDALKTLGKKAAVALVMKLTQEIVNWIDSGFQGNPAFIEDPDNFLESVGDRAIGEFIFNEPGLKFLCDPFKVQIQLALGLQYQPFKEKINCTLSDVLANTENAYDNFVGGDFINGGGWDSWFNITTNPANNSQGAFLIAKSELDARIETSQGNVERETGWGGGALSLKKCKSTEYEVAVDGTKTRTATAPKDFTGSQFYQPVSTSTTPKSTRDPVTGKVTQGTYITTETECNVTTPGTIITNKLGFADTSGQRMTELQTATAGAFDAILSALANQMINYTMDSLKDGLLGGDESKQPDYQAMYEQSIKDLQTGQANTADNVKRAMGNGTGGSGLTSEQIKTETDKIDVALEIEREYISIRTTAKDFLNRLVDKFATARSCVNTYDQQNAPTRKPLFDDIIGIIQGNDTQKPLIGGKIINIKTITDELAIAISNRAKLRDKKNAAETATKLSDLRALTSDISSAPYHNSGDVNNAEQITFTTKINSWAENKIANYASSSKPCAFTLGSIPPIPED